MPSKKLASKTKSNRIADLNSVQLFWVSMTALLLSMIMLCGALIVQSNSGDSRIPFKGFANNELVSSGSVAMQVTSVTTSKGKSIFTAPAGKHYLIVTISIKNTSSKSIYVMPSTDTYVKDASGKMTYLTPYMLESPYRSGELMSGETQIGQLSYLVSDSAKQKLYVDAIWSGRTIPFELN